MQMRALKRRVLLAAMLAGVLAMPGAKAQTFPSQPIKLMVPYAPGGVADITARIVAQKLSEQLGQQVLVDNRPSAGNIVASELVAKAVPDGYTLLWMNGGHAISVALFKSLPYDTVRDFAPVSTVGFFSIALVVNSDSPLKSVVELVAAAKANPAKFNIGTVAIGSTQHIAAELFKSMTGLDVPIVPFKTTPALITALKSHDIQASFEILAPVLPHLRSGNLRALGLTSERRFPGLPGVPTIVEGGVAGYQASAWNAVAAPAKTPQAIIDRLNREINAVLAAPDVRQRLLDLGVEARGSTPEGLRELLTSEIEKWRALIVSAKIERQ